MQILSKGFKLPQTGDFGDVWFPAMEDNIQQTNDHTHDGVNSEKLSGVNLEAFKVNILGTNFVDQGNGSHRQLLTTPGGLDIDTFVMSFKDPTTQDAVYLRVEKVTVSTFYVYTNFVQNFEVYYGV